jgi:8-hydroxy-5-deazaflavin:NADPH oxidoreductase
MHRRGRAIPLVSELPGEAQAGAVGDPLSGDVVVLAVWYQAVPDVLARYGDQLDGRVLVDITNPVDPESYAPLTVEAGSVAQEIAATVTGATVVKLATDGGLRAIDVGPLALAHQLEGAGYLNMAVQPALGTNYGSALKVVA